MIKMLLITDDYEQPKPFGDPVLDTLNLYLCRAMARGVEINLQQDGPQILFKQPNCDVLLFDYGGMSITNTRLVNTWIGKFVDMVYDYPNIDFFVLSSVNEWLVDDEINNRLGDEFENRQYPHNLKSGGWDALSVYLEHLT